MAAPFCLGNRAASIASRRTSLGACDLPLVVEEEETAGGAEEEAWSLEYEAHSLRSASDQPDSSNTAINHSLILQPTEDVTTDQNKMVLEMRREREKRIERDLGWARISPHFLLLGLAMEGHTAYVPLLLTSIDQFLGKFGVDLLLALGEGHDIVPENPNMHQGR